MEDKMRTEKRNINVYQICLTALAVGINIAGGQIALFLKLRFWQALFWARGSA